ncbi:MAG TPA: L-serine ammonia-lyase [Gammaproteobacteria bacterium]|nr:L-serine ammonia-lyase [Gammaproteobacteria bacterium]
MAISVFEIFKVGIGPSSSHTIGPMLAAGSFLNRCTQLPELQQIYRIYVELFGSLGSTGRGHGSDHAVLLGLLGQQPHTVDPDNVGRLLHGDDRRLNIPLANHTLVFDKRDDLHFHKRKLLPLHPNGMRFTARDRAGATLLKKEYYSVGGGFVAQADKKTGKLRIEKDRTQLPYPFDSGEKLLQLCQKNQLRISNIMLANECCWTDEHTVRQQLLDLWQVMQQGVQRGCQQQGVLPGGLHVRRRAHKLHSQLAQLATDQTPDPLAILDWVNLYALAINEENAAGGRIVTAPTNGAAGVLPAVLHYYTRFCAGANEQGIIEFLLTAAAIAILYKENASISGAEVGCQGEVGVACSMAAAALTAAQGGTMLQVENAAEIGMEHNLGLTCDPIGGLVQIPCIERNAMAAIKAINAQRLAVKGDGEHHVTLDKVIQTMRQTGADMKSKYKETSRGGLAVNLVEC